MERIIERVDALIEKLEKEKRITDIFSIPTKETKFISFEKILSELNLDSDQLFNDFYETLSQFISYEPIEIIKKNNDANDSKDQSFAIVEHARPLSLLLSLLERDEHQNKHILFSNPESAGKFIYLKCLLIIFLCSSSFEYEYSEENLESVKSHVEGDVFYRGHSDITYTIIPSMIRSLKHSCRIDYPFIEKKYADSKLFDKYKECVDRGATINYDFCSFIQHATSYSPLIDFTKDCNIALSFATYPNGNLNVYNSTDASLIMLAIKRYENIINIRNIDLDYHASKLRITSKIYGKHLYKCTLEDFDILFGLSTRATNDRMKYQKGVFFCFYRCVIVKGIPLIPRSKGYLLTFRIRAKDNTGSGIEDKPTIYNRIINFHPELEYNHLMNPYDYFGEYNK